MEKDMGPVIQLFFENQGYTIQSEIEHIDMVARKEDTLIAIEMKNTLSVSLMHQGLKRLSFTDHVFLAIPKPSSTVISSRTFKEKKTIVRRLELGLLWVDLKQQKVDVIFEPGPYALKKITKKKIKLLHEFNERKTHLNQAGSSKTPLMTAYREKAIRILLYLSSGPKSTQEIRTHLRSECTSLLQKNYYGWFQRVKKGVYTKTDLGDLYLSQNHAILHLFQNT